MAYNVLTAEFASEGCVVVEGVISAQAADELYAAFDQLPLGGSPSSVPGATRAPPGERGATLLQDPRFLDVVLQPALLETVEEVLGDDDPPTCIRGDRDSCRRRQAARLALRLPFPNRGAARGGCAFYLQDMRDEAGPLYVVPGSHLEPRAVREEVEAELPDEVKLPLVRGSAVIFHGRLWHTGSTNASDRPRRRPSFPTSGSGGSSGWTTSIALPSPTRSSRATTRWYAACSGWIRAVSCTALRTPPRTETGSEPLRVRRRRLDHAPFPPLANVTTEAVRALGHVARMKRLDDLQVRDRAGGRRLTFETRSPAVSRLSGRACREAV